MSNTSPAKAGVHLSAARARDRWVPAFPTELSPWAEGPRDSGPRTVSSRVGRPVPNSQRRSERERVSRNTARSFRWRLGERPGIEFSEGGFGEVGRRRIGKAARQRQDFGIKGICPCAILGLGSRRTVVVGALQFRLVGQCREGRVRFVGETKAGGLRRIAARALQRAADDRAHCGRGAPYVTAADRG